VLGANLPGNLCLLAAIRGSAAALADFLLGVGSELGLPTRAVVFVALTAAAFVLAGISLRVAEQADPRLLVPLGTGLLGASLVYFLAGRRTAAQ